MLIAKCESPFWMLKKAIPGTLNKGQDAVNGRSSNGITAIAIADGVTSAGDYAGFGAKAATKAISIFLIEKFDEIVESDEDKLHSYLFKFFKNYYLKELNEIAKENGLPLVLGEKNSYRNFTYYSTTILACAIKEDRLIVIKIGNGIIAADIGQGFGVVSPSETVQGKTPCIERIYDPGFSDFLFKRYCIPSLISIVLMSDGVEHIEPYLYDEIGKNLTNNFISWFDKAIESRESFSNSVDSLGIVGKDDISIAMLIKQDKTSKPSKVINGNPLKGCELYSINNIDTFDIQTVVGAVKNSIQGIAPEAIINSVRELVDSVLVLEQELIAICNFLLLEKYKDNDSQSECNRSTNEYQYCEIEKDIESEKGSPDKDPHSFTNVNIEENKDNDFRSKYNSGTNEYQCCKIEEDIEDEKESLDKDLHSFTNINIKENKDKRFQIINNNFKSVFLSLGIQAAYTVFIIIAAFAVFRCFNSEKTNLQMPTMFFGEFEWYILEEENGEMLLLSKDVIKKAAYQTISGTMTWENSDIREYLNSQFLSLFSYKDRERILRKSIQTYSTSLNLINGNYIVVQDVNQTIDRVFLLSAEEIEKYFSVKSNTIDRKEWWIQHYGNEELIIRPYLLRQVSINGTQAKYKNEFTWWWLRSPAYYEEGTAVIEATGDLNMGGYISNNQEGGIRPAMWITSKDNIEK